VDTERLQGRDLSELEVDQQLDRIVGDVDSFLTVGQNKAS
jgi:hypothetical protein